MFNLSEPTPLPLRSVEKSPVPEGCTMKGLPYMPLDTERLQRSRAWARCERMHSLAFALMNLWMAAWHGFPAGSLEDDDDVIRVIAKCNPQQWEDCRAEALRGWMRCRADGRLYHPTVSEKATQLWGERTAYRESMARARAAKAAKKAKACGEPEQQRLELPVVAAEPAITPTAPESRYPDSGDSPADRNETPVQAAAQAEKPPVPPVCNRALSEKLEEERTRLRLDTFGVVTGIRAQLWSDGLVDLRTMTGLSESKGRGLLGRLLKRAGDDCGLVRAVLNDAIDTGPMDPVAWLVAAVETRAGRGKMSEIDRWAEEYGIGDIDDLPKDTAEAEEWARNGRYGEKRASNCVELAQVA